METSPPIVAKRCSTCGLEKPIDQFRQAAGYKDGRTGQCWPCRLAVMNEWRRKRPVLAPPEGFQRKCNGCGKMCTADELVKDKSRKYGVSSHCGPCWAEKQKGYRAAAGPAVAARYMRVHRKRNYAAVLERHFKRVYNITVEDYLKLLDEQDGLCAICHQLNIRTDGRLKPLEVDHRHDETRAVRGLLCHRCNSTMGRIGDDSGWLWAAALYLEQAVTSP